MFTRLIFWRRRGVRWQRVTAPVSLIGLIGDVRRDQCVCAGFDWLEFVWRHVSGSAEDFGAEEIEIQLRFILVSYTVNIEFASILKGIVLLYKHK